MFERVCAYLLNVVSNEPVVSASCFDIKVHCNRTQKVTSWDREQNSQTNNIQDCPELEFQEVVEL